MTTNQKKSKIDLKTIYKKVSTIILMLIMLLAIIACLSLFVQVIKGNKPNLFGYRFYYIITDSMMPELEVNDVILSKVINNIDEAKNIKEGDVVTFVAAEGVQQGLTITHKVISEPHFDETRNKYIILTSGIKPGATVDPPVPLENVKAIMVKKVAIIGNIYSFVTSYYGIIILVVAPMSLIIGLLVVRLVKTIKNKPEQQKELTKEDIARKAVEEYKEKEKLEAEIARKAVEEYIKNQEKDK